MTAEVDLWPPSAHAHIPPPPLTATTTAPSAYMIRGPENRGLKGTFLPVTEAPFLIYRPREQPNWRNAHS